MTVIATGFIPLSPLSIVSMIDDYVGKKPFAEDKLIVAQMMELVIVF